MAVPELPPKQAADLKWFAGKLLQLISVKDFGAVGDGVADDSSAIQDALDYAASSFGSGFPPSGRAYAPPIVLFPVGCYRLTKTLNVYNGLTLKGQGGV